jgi:general stress protein CsbA
MFFWYHTSISALFFPSLLQILLQATLYKKSQSASALCLLFLITVTTHRGPLSEWFALSLKYHFSIPFQVHQALTEIYYFWIKREDILGFPDAISYSDFK